MRPNYVIATEIDGVVLADSKMGSDWILRHSLDRHVSRFSQRLSSSATCLWDYNRFKGDGPVMDASYLRWWIWALVKDSQRWYPHRFWIWVRNKIEPQVPSAESIQDCILSQKYWLECKELEPRAVIVHPAILDKLRATPFSWYFGPHGSGINMGWCFFGLRVIVNPDMRRWSAYVV